MTTYQDVDKAFRETMLIEDPYILPVMLATTLSHFTEGDPIWVIFIGPSSGGKTEFLSSLFDVDAVRQLSILTQNTFLSGLERRDTGNTSLLQRYPNPIFVMQDLGAIISKRNDDQREIMGQLREIYNGYLVKSTGMGKDISWKGKVTLLVASTSSVDDSLGTVVNQQLGERFLSYRIRQPSRITSTEASLSGSDTKAAARDTRREVVKEFIQGRLGGKCRPVSKSVKAALPALADFAALARSDVPRDPHYNVTRLPMPEYGGRLVVQLNRLGESLPLIDHDIDIWPVLYKVATDSIPPTRWGIIKILLAAGIKGRTLNVITDEINLPKTTVWRTLQDLSILGIIVGIAGNGLDESVKWQLLVDESRVSILSPPSTPQL